MNATLVWNNVLAYSLQIGLLVAAGAFVPALVRMRAAGARLAYWQLLLAACLLLPWVRPWHREVIVASVSVTTVVTSVAVPAPEHFHIAWGEWLLYLLAAGVVVRVVWLGVGLWQLRRYRRRAWPLEGACAHAEVLLSAEVSSPVTFGWRRPVILLPERFPQLSEPMRQAILCHENLHVERRDWLFTVAEELVRAALWFHPAIWWLLAEIQLAREQAVDARVVRITRSRDPYVDALLEMAGARPELELAPAPLFLRKRHLKQRVVEIVREATMSKTRWISALAASVVFLAGACWLVTGAFPLAAAPQMAAEGAGVTVDFGGAPPVSHAGAAYPIAALAKRVEGTVVATIKIDDNGAVKEANIVSGPDELRAVVNSVMNWHFGKEAAGTTRQVSITFVLPKGDLPNLSDAEIARETRRAAARAMWERSGGPPLQGKPIKGIVVNGLSEQAKEDLLARLPVHAGDILTSDLITDIDMALGKYDRRLGVATFADNGEPMIQIAPQDSREFARAVNGGYAPLPPGAPAELETGAPGAGRIRVSGNVEAANLISQVEPVYPPLAKQARIQGAVVLSAIIGKDGHVRDLKLVQGHPLLVPAALDAVRNWVYRPTTINGEATEVRTEININFNLPPDENAPTVKRIRVGGNVEAANLVTQVAPHYPAEAKQSGIQGAVKLQGLIGKDGHVQDLQVLSGEPVLAEAAVEAVKQWVYRPTLLSGEPVEVQTTIDVNFTLQ